MEKPHGIAIDAIMRKIYWTDYGTQKIQRSNMDGTNVEDIVTSGLVKPYGLAVDMTDTPGKVYWVSARQGREGA